MTRSIASALEELKLSIREALGPDMIQTACRAVGYGWRERTLGPIATVWMFALQIINRTACTEAIRLLPNVEVTDGGYCQARKRIPLLVQPDKALVDVSQHERGLPRPGDVRPPGIDRLNTLLGESRRGGDHVLRAVLGLLLTGFNHKTAFWRRPRSSAVRSEAHIPQIAER